MWPFFKNKQQVISTEAEHKRCPLEFAEIIAGIGDFSDLENNEVAFKFWLPEPVERALNEIKERSNVSMSEFLRQVLAIHCYGLYAYYVMTDANRFLFKDQNGVLFSRATKKSPVMEQNHSQQNQAARKRIDTYWVPELGKNIAPVKVWIPKRLKNDLSTLAQHANLTLSNYVREIVISRLMGQGMLPTRPEMFRASPTQETDAWNEGRDVPWREVTEEECRHHSIVEVRPQWVDIAK